MSARYFGKGAWKVDLSIVFKIAAVGIILAVLGQVLMRSGREDIATLTTLAGLSIVLIMVVKIIVDLFGQLKTLFQIY